MNIYYHLSNYISHRKSGLDYIKAIKSLGWSIVESVHQADLIIIHDDPLNYPAIIHSFGNISSKKIISYSVWETEDLPKEYIEPLSMVDEIWTCSTYSANAFKKKFDNVKILEHIVYSHSFLQEELSKISKIIKFNTEYYYFYTIIDSINPRKNLASILECFISTFKKQKNVFLIVKQYRHPLNISSLPQIISIENNLSENEISALHHFCNCYISLHHSEAWGLSISEAMISGNNVIATGYSGNMEYMNEKNSFPVNYILKSIQNKMCELIPLYTSNMKWAFPDLNHAKYYMKKVYKKRGEKLINPALGMEKFDFDTISKKIYTYINEKI